MCILCDLYVVRSGTCVVCLPVGLGTVGCVCCVGSMLFALAPVWLTYWEDCLLFVLCLFIVPFDTCVVCLSFSLVAMCFVAWLSSLVVVCCVACLSFGWWLCVLSLGFTPWWLYVV